MHCAEKLRIMGVDAEVLDDVSRPTTLKQRFRAKREDTTACQPPAPAHHQSGTVAKLTAKISEVLDDTDLMIFFGL